jgi:hypothetical protein
VTHRIHYVASRGPLPIDYDTKPQWERTEDLERNDVTWHSTYAAARRAATQAGTVKRCELKPLKAWARNRADYARLLSARGRVCEPLHEGSASAPHRRFDLYSRRQVAAIRRWINPRTRAADEREAAYERDERGAIADEGRPSLGHALARVNRVLAHDSEVGS